jgi:hypothetical protein
MLRHARRVVLYDPAEDPSWIEDGFRPVSVGELATDTRLLAADRCKLVVHPKPDEFREKTTQTPTALQMAEIETLCDLQRAAGNLVSVWDEVGDYTESGNDALQRLARNGRHQGIACVFISQCAVEIPKRVRRQATRIVSFIQSEPSDLAALEEKCGEQFANEAREWRRGRPPALWCLPSLEAPQPTKKEKANP